MPDEPEVLDGETVEDGPDPELKPAVDEKLPEVSSDIVVQDPSDQHELMIRMDEHDVQMLLQQVQSAALRKWVYTLPGNKLGLTIHAMQDITQRMNWTGKTKIGVLPETLEVEQVLADEGNGEEPFYVATIFARDEVTGAMLPGSAMEPQRMKLKDSTAAQKRAQGQSIPEDNKVFDRFARTKAIQKATRNAIGAFIPEEIEQTVIAMFSRDPSRVQRIQTEAEAKVADLPPALTDERAVEQVAKARALYDEIRELGGGRGKLDITPGHFHAYLTAAQHSHDRLEDLLGWLEERKQALSEHYAKEAGS